MTRKNLLGMQRAVLEMVSEDGIPMRVAREIALHDDWMDRRIQWLRDEAIREEEETKRQADLKERRRQVDAGIVPLPRLPKGAVNRGSRRTITCRHCGEERVTRAVYHSRYCCGSRMLEKPRFVNVIEPNKKIVKVRKVKPKGACSICGRTDHNRTRCKGPDEPPRRRGKTAQRYHIRNPITGYLVKVHPLQQALQMQKWEDEMRMRGDI